MTTERYVLLDGWQHRRRPVHWQGWLAEQLTDAGAVVDYPTLPRPEAPSREAWCESIARVVGESGDAQVVAHGLVVWAWLSLAAGERSRPLAKSALLVAPPAPGSSGGDVAAPLPAEVDSTTVRRLAPRTLMVCAVDDPFAPGAAATRLGESLEVETIELPAGGHLNSSSGFGPWPAALHWCLHGEWLNEPGGTVAAPRVTEVSTVAPGALLETLRHRFRPAGVRLGAAVAADADQSVVGDVEAVVRAAGLDPRRRVARLRPREGEDRLRLADVDDFVTRYGHEYGVVVLPEADRDDGVGASVADTCRRNGCDLVWVGRP